RKLSSTACLMCLRDCPRWFGSSPIWLCTLVAMTTRSRLTPSFFRQLPSTTSLCPSEYTSAVSKKLMPRSSACLMKGRDSVSPNTQLRHSGEPKVMVPRQIWETLSPVEPRLTYFMLTAPTRPGASKEVATLAVKSAHFEPDPSPEKIPRSACRKTAHGAERRPHLARVRGRGSERPMLDASQLEPSRGSGALLG